jgi:hypothetical protein
MQMILELPSPLNERLNQLTDPQGFIITVLSRSLGLDLPPAAKSSRIEDAFGLHQPTRSLSVEDMETVLQEAVIEHCR